MAQRIFLVSIIALLIQVTLTIGQSCPTIKRCTTCSTTDHFTITCNPFVKYVSVKCNSKTVLDRFHVKFENLTEPFNKLQLKDCRFQTDSTISSFVKKLGLLENLSGLVLNGPNFLSPLTAGHFKNFKNLSLLIVENWAVDSSLNPFRKLVNLRRLSLASNNIRFIDDYALKNLKQLKALVLSNNTLRAISRETFSGLQKLIQLDLSHNRLSVIDQNAFKNLVNLKILDLSHNELRFLNPFTISGQSLVDLSLANNKITKLYSEWLDLKHLRVLNLQSNRITQISSENLAFKSTDVYLNLMNNQIRTIRIDPEKLSTIMKNDSKMTNVLVDFSFNPVQCDHQTYNLTQYFNNKLEPNIKKVFHFVLQQWKCNEL